MRLRSEYATVQRRRELVKDETELELKLQTVSNELVQELITLTPEVMNEIQFEIVSTDDGGADIGLMDIHPDVKYVELSPLQRLRQGKNIILFSSEQNRCFAHLKDRDLVRAGVRWRAVGSR